MKLNSKPQVRRLLGKLFEHCLRLFYCFCKWWIAIFAHFIWCSHTPYLILWRHVSTKRIIASLHERKLPKFVLRYFSLWKVVHIAWASFHLYFICEKYADVNYVFIIITIKYYYKNIILKSAKNSGILFTPWLRNKLHGIAIKVLYLMETCLR
jgi:hypothetical protein